jgi:hypothetical protein
MKNELGRLETTRKNGAERFHSAGESLGFDLKSFWQWSGSDLLGNTARGVVAEFLVARAIGQGKDGVRDEWCPFDLQTSSGARIQIKSAAYVQSWHQDKFSTISFNVQARQGWDPDTNLVSKTAERHSDLYVFALLAHKNKQTIDPMNVDQWMFYILPTSALDNRKRSQHSITLKSLEALCAPVSYSNLGSVIETIAKSILSNKAL